MKIEDRMIRARYLLIKNEPFYGIIASQLDWLISDEIPTCATDGLNIYWNVDFFNLLSEEEIQFVIIHEIHHVIKLHTCRRKLRNKFLWNAACDFQINLELRDTNYTNRRYNLISSDKIQILIDDKYKGMYEEQIYNDILNDEEEYSDFQSIGGVLDIGNPTEADMAEAHRKIEGMVTKAATYARQAGKLPGGLRQYVEELVEPKVNWTIELQRFLDPIIPTSVNWNPPNRRMIHNNIYIPGLQKEGAGEIVFGIDTSGSIGHEEIKQFWSEIDYVMENIKPSKMHTLYFHSSVWFDESFELGRCQFPDKIETGGTNFQAVFDRIEEKDINPRCLIMLTDMYDEFPPEPNYPVIWIATTKTSAPYGKTIYIL